MELLMKWGKSSDTSGKCVEISDTSSKCVVIPDISSKCVVTFDTSSKRVVIPDISSKRVVTFEFRALVRILKVGTRNFFFYMNFFFPNSMKK